ncbi:VOC family protein [Jannaschia sp. LMIT008]|uniref:VOC family protein n=1 Tax=Jannaschia maritima TaxID=3032585 RepID=UPI002811D0F6|nr:VOC family protein [Jannaschia sp. LMIT008]
MTPYLHFDGTCADAFRFYDGLFNGALTLMRYGDAPEPVPGAGPADEDRIMHAELRGDGWAVMGDDVATGQTAPKGASIMHVVADMAAGRALCDGLADGGTVAMPFGPTFFAPGFGQVTDRFGTDWMIYVDA